MDSQSQTPPAQAQQTPIQTTSDKSFVAAWLLSLFLGVLGVDRFYMGYVGLGIIKLITFGGCGIWYLIDLILIITGSLKANGNKPLSGYAENKKIAIIVTCIFLGLSLLSSIATRDTSNITINKVTAPGTKQTVTTVTTETTKAKSWTKVAELTGDADKSSETIHLSGGQVRLTYSFTGSDTIIGAVYLMDEGKDLSKDGGIPVVMVTKASSDQTILRKSAGDYYLQVTTANAAFTITLEELK